MNKPAAKSPPSRGRPRDPTLRARREAGQAVVGQLMSAWLTQGGEPTYKALEEKLQDWLSRHPYLSAPFGNSIPGRTLTALQRGDALLSWERLAALVKAGRALKLLPAANAANAAWIASLVAMKSGALMRAWEAQRKGSQLLWQLFEAAQALDDHVRDHKELIALVSDREGLEDVWNFPRDFPPEAFLAEVLNDLGEPWMLDLNLPALLSQLRRARLVSRLTAADGLPPPETQQTFPLRAALLSDE